MWYLIVHEQVEVRSRERWSWAKGSRQPRHALQNDESVCASKGFASTKYLVSAFYESHNDDKHARIIQ